MKIGLGSAFVLALLFHGALFATLVINVSLDKPKKPEEKLGQIMHATIVNVPPAKGSPTGTPPKKVQVQDTAKQAAEAAAKAKAAAEAKAKAELEKQLAAQKKAEAERQKALALKKAKEEKKKAEEAKKIAEEEAKKKAEAEAKKKAEEEAKKKAEAEAKKKAEAEAKKQAELEAIAKQMAAEQAARLEAQQADDLEQDLLGQAHGVEGGEGLGSGTGSSDSLTYGNKVQQLIEQNWRIDPSMNGKKVVVTVSVDNEGMIYNEKCQGDNAVCASAIATLNLIGMLPRPPQGCKDCNTIVITMTPKI